MKSDDIEDLGKVFAGPAIILVAVIAGVATIFMPEKIVDKYFALLSGAIASGATMTVTEIRRGNSGNKEVSVEAEEIRLTQPLSPLSLPRQQEYITPDTTEDYPQYNLAQRLPSEQEWDDRP